MTSTRARLTSTAFAIAIAALGCSDGGPPEVALDEDVAVETATDTDRRERRRARPSAPNARDNDDNRPPIVRSLTVGPSKDDAAKWVVTFETDDADGDDVRADVVWFVNGSPAARGEHIFDPTSSRRGDSVHVEVTPHDGSVAGAMAASSRLAIANAAPAITSQPPASMAGGVYRYMVEATDADGDQPLRYELLQSPTGMRIDGFTGELTWRPTAGQAGTHTIEIAVSDSQGALSAQEFALPIIPPAAAPAAPAY